MNKVASSLLQNGSYTFLGEESYENESVVSAIPKGIGALVSMLRTTNIFPIQPYAVRIAESVTELYNGSREESMELFFDDADLLSVQVLAEERERKAAGVSAR